VKELAVENVTDLRPQLYLFRIGMTEEVWKEIVHFQLAEFTSKEELYIAPISSLEIEQALTKFPTLQIFDLADQTLIMAAIRDQGVILTDDGDLFLEAQAMGIQVLRLPMFCLELARNTDFPKRTVHQCLKYWEEHGSYEKRAIKRWKIELRAIA
jgi:hypothetical protein